MSGIAVPSGAKARTLATRPAKSCRCTRASAELSSLRLAPDSRATAAANAPAAAVTSAIAIQTPRRERLCRRFRRSTPPRIGALREIFSHRQPDGISLGCLRGFLRELRC